MNYKEEVILICSEDGQMLEIAEGKHSLYLRCPWYRSEVRKSKRPCMNRVSKEDADKIYKKVEEMDKEGLLDGLQHDTKSGTWFRLILDKTEPRKLPSGIKFRIDALECEIISVNSHFIEVTAKNKRKIK